MVSEETDKAAYRSRTPALRGVIGGVLMGLANLVPGISGGTMLLAVGVYPQFIDGVAEVSTFRFRPRSIVLLGCIVAGALVAILGLAGPIRGLVIDHRWVMYSLFIGLTLGGVPLLYRMVKPLDTVVIVGAVVGLAAMIGVAMLGGGDAAAGPAEDDRYLTYFLAGLVAASAMVLPGISGSYLLVLMGQYLAILAAVDLLKDAVKGRAWSPVVEALPTLVPVVLGVVLGVVGVSNLVRILLRKFHRATVGVLLGILLGALLGLWPFRVGVAPEPGDVIKSDVVVLVDGELVMETSGRVVDPEDYPMEAFSPGALRMAAAAGLILLGFGASMAVARFGGGSEEDRS